MHPWVTNPIRCGPELYILLSADDQKCFRKHVHKLVSFSTHNQPVGQRDCIERGTRVREERYAAELRLDGCLQTPSRLRP
jgi:hypothetical protein